MTRKLSSPSLRKSRLEPDSPRLDFEPAFIELLGRPFPRDLLGLLSTSPFNATTFVLEELRRLLDLSPLPLDDLRSLICFLLPNSSSLPRFSSSPVGWFKPLFRLTWFADLVLGPFALSILLRGDCTALLLSRHFF